jgi:oligoribonuclease (3'-5' exoribonuclease)
MSELNLDGGEVAVLKAIGMSGLSVRGDQLIEKVKDFAEAELIDTLLGLIMLGYVISDKQSLHDMDDVQQANFRINSGYLKDIRDSIDPRRKEANRSSRRVRRE